MGTVFAILYQALEEQATDAQRLLTLVRRRPFHGRASLCAREPLCTLMQWRPCANLCQCRNVSRAHVLRALLVQAALPAFVASRKALRRRQGCTSGLFDRE